MFKDIMTEGRRFVSIFALFPIFFLLLSIHTVNAEGGFSFLVLSDVPYTAKEDFTLRQTIVPAVQKDDTPFVIHLGDMKNSKIPCTEELLAGRRDQIFSLHPGRVFYTPGDNDWTDCDRTQINYRYSELNRLDLLRRLFYGKPLKLPKEWAYGRQSLYPENMRWIHNGVVFATVHLVATNNGREEILLDDVDLALTLVDARDRANILWLEKAFETARNTNAPAIIIATQADVTKFKYPSKCTILRRQKCDAFATFKTSLKALSAAYRKPVLFIHGDTNPYCLDKDFGGSRAPNLWRFNSTGDYALVDAAKISVHPKKPADPFTFTSLVQNIVPAEGC
ncbi:MAG: hypothetical protein COB93_07670 [Sneathiella sp.]|nr:MAG: hypothetical protein COB93_07670 [Sneathiella sp.]